MSAITYQLNGYFGIHYDYTVIDDVLSAIDKHSKFSALNRDAAEVTIGKFTLVASTNSDSSDMATRGLIFVDEMTFGGPDVDAAEDGFLALEPAEMEKREKKCEQAVNAVTDLYELIVKDFKSRKLSLKKLYLGWMVVSCSWDDELSDSASTDQ